MGDQMILVNHFREMYENLGHQLYAFTIAQMSPAAISLTWDCLPQAVKQKYRNEAQRIVTEICEDTFVRFLIVEEDKEYRAE